MRRDGKLFAILAMLLLSFGAVAALAEDGPVLMDFYAPWCSPCREMAPTVDQLALDGYAVQRIDIDCDRAMAQRYRVDAVPTFIVVERGREIDRVSGTVSIERLKQKLRRPNNAGPAKQGIPTRAWRYAEPTGSRAAIVRIYCQEGTGVKWQTRSIGSGTLVRWAGKIVVLTARHVVKDAKKIIVEAVTGKTYYGTVLKVDAVWDCAVIELKGTPNVQPAEIEMGDAALLREGAVLESCGYGPDGKLAINSGRFLSYKRSNAAMNGPDDWMEISGYARQGDSGGPVFNERGRLVGVLWGTDGKVVVCVQSGRLHLLLDSAIPKVQQRAYIVPQSMGKLVPVAIQRSPTPPMPGPEPYQQPGDSASGCGPGGCSPTAGAQTAPGGNFLLPYRSGEAAKDAAMAAQLERVNENLQAIQAQIANQQRQAPPPVVAPPAEKPADDASKMKTAIGRLTDKEASWLAEHGGPISSRLAANAEENMDSESAAVRFKGFTQAKVALLIFCAAIVGIGLVLLMLIHKINNKAIPKLQELAAKTSNTVDDKLVELLAKIHGRVDTVEEKVKAQLPDLSALKAKADSALHVATQAAIAVVPGAAQAKAAVDAVQTLTQ